MAHIARMKICDRFSDVSENLTSILLAHLVATFNPTEQLATLTVLHYQVDFVVGFVGLVEFNKVRMVELFHQINFSNQSTWLCHFVFTDDLDGSN